MPPKLTAREAFEKALKAHYGDGNVSEALTLYQAASQLYAEEGAPRDAKTCLEMGRIALEISKDEPHAMITPQEAPPTDT